MSDSNLGGGLAGGAGSGLGSTGGGLSGAGGSTGGDELRGVGQVGSTGEGFTESGTFTTGDDFDAHDVVYQRHYATVTPEHTTPTVTTYDEARTGYAAGHRAAANPVYANREYEEVEVELEREQPGRLSAMRGYARHAFEWKRVLGALALAGGAYWVGRKLFEAVQEMGTDEEQDCRTYYESHPARASVPYDQARTVYVVGYVAARNPEYAGRSYDEVEPSLRTGFTGSRAGSYDSLRDFGRRGYERGTSRAGTTGMGSSGTTGGLGTSGTTGI
ncbi:hypothetical protein [Longimicrobium sp.]|uniref:hypothetical protein n=1 Tax=Longimicrobium sp. TaxID=2029185 RepID=UPI002E2FE30C|nr:hypothetical protein [Longimicrobium sp.]HEX6042140.1 hypothetical protein [Longimicrobium sp.]